MAPAGECASTPSGSPKPITSKASGGEDMNRLESNQKPNAKESEVDAGLASEWRKEFEAAAKRPLATRFRYAFIHTYKPVLDDAPFRSFDTTADYRRWCEENLPDWLGYGRV